MQSYIKQIELKTNKQLSRYNHICFLCRQYKKKIMSVVYGAVSRISTWHLYLIIGGVVETSRDDSLWRVFAAINQVRDAW